jgi:hypothetical protein
MFRLDPVMPPSAYKTYSIRSPISTHYRPASCAEVECDAYAHGWTTTIDISAVLYDPATGKDTGFTGADQADFIRAQCGRKFTEEMVGLTTVAFRFFPGQRGFAPEHDHKVSLERPEHYLVRSGDWRGNPRGDGILKHHSAADWIDDFGEHQQRLAHRLAQG